MNLTSLYISNGKWHQLEVTYDNNYLLLSGDYRRFSAKSSTFAKITSSSFIKVGGVGEKSFVGCLKGEDFLSKPFVYSFYASVHFL